MVSHTSKTTFEKIRMEVDADTFHFSPQDNIQGKIEVVYNPTYDFYKEWHNRVGEPFGWHTRARINDVAGITNLLEQPTTEMILLKKDGVAVGYALTERNSSELAEIADFGFDPALTGMGLGTFFFPMIVERLLDQGIKSVWLTTRTTNDPRVAKFYEKFGFIITGREPIPIDGL